MMGCVDVFQMKLFELLENGFIPDPDKYKICCGCESVVVRSPEVATCPLCNTYRFETSPEEVIAGIYKIYNRRKEGKRSTPDFEDD